MAGGPTYRVNDDGSVNVKDRYGESYSVPEATARDLMAKGEVQPLSEKERTDAIEAKEYDRPLEAFGASALNAATLGLASNIAKDYYSKVRKHNPVSFGAGDIATTAAAAIATGGLAGAARGGAGVAAKSLGRKVARNVLTGAGEGAVISAKDVATDYATTSPNMTAKDVAKRIVGGAALGGGLSMAALGLGAAGKKVGGAIAEKVSGRPVRALMAQKKALKSDLAMLEKLGGPEAVAAAAARGEASAAAKAAAKAKLGQREKDIAQIAKLARYQDDAVLPAVIRKDIEQAIRSGDITLARKALSAIDDKTADHLAKVALPHYPQGFGDLKKLQRISGLQKIQPFADDIAALSKRVDDAAQAALKAGRKRVGGKPLPGGGMHGGRVTLEKEAKAALVGDMKALSGRIDDALGAGEKQVELSLLNAMKKAEGRAAHKEAILARNQADVDLDRALSGWKPESGVAAPDLAARLAEVEGKLAAAQTGAYESAGRALNSARGAMGLVGYAATESLMAGVSGWAVAGLLNSSLAKNAILGLGRKVAGAAPQIGRASRLVITSALSPDEMQSTHDALSAANPAQVKQTATQGYLQAGFSPRDADEMGAYEARKADLLKSGLPRVNGSIERAAYTRLQDAASNPRRAIARVKRGMATKEDLLALRTLLPKIWAQLEQEARKADVGKMTAGQRSQAMRIADPARHAAMVQQIQGIGQMQAPQPATPRASVKTPPGGGTTLDRMQSQGGLLGKG